MPSAGPSAQRLRPRAPHPSCACRPPTANARSSTARSPISPRSASRARRANSPSDWASRSPCSIAISRTSRRWCERVYQTVFEGRWNPSVDRPAAGPLHAPARAPRRVLPPVRRGDLPARVDPHLHVCGPLRSGTLNRQATSSSFARSCCRRTRARGAACLRAGRHGTPVGRGGDRVRVEPARRHLLQALREHVYKTRINVGFPDAGRLRGRQLPGRCQATYPQLLARFAPEALGRPRAARAAGRH